MSWPQEKIRPKIQNPETKESLSQAVYCYYYYLRAHKKEPVMRLNVAYALANGLLVWGLGSHFGAMGASAGYLITTGLILFPFSTLIFFRCRREWHQT